MLLKLVMINNRCHGMVRQFQHSYFDSRYQSTMWGYSAPAEVEGALRWLWSEPQRPMLLEVDIATCANVYPKIAFGRPITDMEPSFQPKGMEGT